MRIAYLINQYPKVSHTFIRREIAALERRGWSIDRYSVRGWEDDIRDPADVLERSRTRYLLQGGLGGLAIEVLRLALKRPGVLISALRETASLAWRADRPWPYHLVYLAQACRLARWMGDSQVRHVHAHFGTNASEVALLAARLVDGGSFSFTVHGPEEFDKPGALKLGHKIARARFAVAVSSFGRSQLWRWAPLADWPKVAVVHCGLEQDAFLPTAQLTTGAPTRLVCVGRLCEQKGQLLLVRAVAALRDAGRSFHLVLAGDGEMRNEIEREIQLARLSDRVSITGWVDGVRVRQEILQARAMILPSFAEGLPVAIMEAMALGRPVITTSIAGIPELVRDGVDGWVVPAGDQLQLEGAIAECLDANEARLGVMGRSARDRVFERHNIDDQAAVLARLLEATERAP